MQASQFTSMLIIGSNAPGALENIYLRALRHIGMPRVDLFDVDRHKHELPRGHLIFRATNRMTRSWSNYSVRRALHRYLARRSYELAIVFKGMEFSRCALDSYRRLSPATVWVNINPDDPFNIDSRGATNAEVLKSLSFFDLYCTWSRRLATSLPHAGCRRVIYLPFGYDRDKHRPPLDRVEVVPGLVTFVGAWDEHREQQLMSLADFDLRIYGEAWSRVARDSPLARKVVAKNVYGEELARIVAKSAVSLNLLRSQNNGSHNMRTFEIPAMGGLMLTTRSLEQQEVLPENEACLMFSDNDELRQKIQWTVQNPTEALNIRKRGCELVQGNTYDARANILIDAILKMRASL